MGSFGQGGRFEEVFINEKQSGLCVRQRTWYAAGTVFRRLPALFLRFRVLSSKKPILFEKKHSGLLQKINGTVGCYLDDGICYWENRQAKMSVIYWTMYWYAHLTQASRVRAAIRIHLAYIYCLLISISVFVHAFYKINRIIL